MITWVASYPRSGNSLFLILLYQVFGLKFWTKYSRTEPKDSSVFSGYFSGGEWAGLPWPEQVKALREDSQMHYVKTHDLPEGTEPCFYIVRDPVASIVSYWHFIHDFENVSIPLVEVALGRYGYGSWSDHVSAWDPLSRKDTFLVRYEDMVDESNKVIQSLSLALGKDPMCEWDGHISRFKHIHPKFFRRGSNQANREEMPPLLRSLVEALSEEAMTKMGYLPEAEGSEERILLRYLFMAHDQEVAQWRALAEERLALINSYPDKPIPLAARALATLRQITGRRHR